jgi:vitellogenic carboxypeptidase-like protein
MFYWFMEKIGGNVTSDDVPMVMWLQGGPGCSSMTGNFFEFGPLEIGSSGNMTLREDTWLQDYHLLFVDNPIGSGYSFAASDDDFVTTEDQMADNLYKLL